MTPSFRLALSLLALTCMSPASGAVANVIQFTNSSDHPLVGFELETLEAGSETPARRDPIFLPGALLPDQSTTFHVAVDEALVARGGHQRLRFYWSSGRECTAYLTVNPKGGPGIVATGDRLCRDGKVPSSPAIGLAARLMVARDLAARDPASAIFELNALVAEYGPQHTSLHLRGELYLQVGRTDLAEVDFQADVEFSSDAGHEFYDQALVYFAQGRGYEALESLSSAVLMSPDNAQYLRDRARLYCYAGEHERMRQDEADAAALGDTQAPLGSDCTGVAE